jgi:NAD(P)H-hydrate epimerase
MAANSAVRSGAGLVTLAVPASLNSILEIKTDEAMTHPAIDSGGGFFAAEAYSELVALAAGKSAVALGPGISTNPAVIKLVRELLAHLALPLVIDADGLNAVANDVEILRHRPAHELVLTPHPGEMSRMTGLSVAAVEADRIAVATEFAQEFKAFLVLKGARTVIAAPDGRVAINGSGNPGMASGGMGDVLTGVIVSLVGQGYDLWDACRLGIFAHGLAGDLVAAEKGEMGISARDVQEKLPYAFREISRGWEE